MKAVLLYVSLVSLAWAQSDLPPHYKKAKQKCMGEHQITVKGRHTKHGFYIFNYVYSSLVPNNQTQIKKEDHDKNISSAAPRSGKENVFKKPIDNLTAQQKGEQHKHLAEMGKDGQSEDRRRTESSQNLNGHHGNSRKWGVYQHHLEFIVGKGENKTTTGDTGIDGSGDMGYLNQVDSHLGITIDSEGHDPGKERHDMRGTGYDKPLGKDQDSKSGLSGEDEPSKGGSIKIGEKKTDASVFQDMNSNSSIPRKSKDPQNKGDSKGFLKGKTDVTHKVQGREGGGYTGLLDKTKEDTYVHTHLSGQTDVTHKVQGREGGGYTSLLDKTKEDTYVHTHLSGHGNISVALLRKTENGRNGRNNTHSSDTDEIKIANGKVIHKTQGEKKGADEHAMISRKLNGEKDRSGVTKPSQKGEMRNYSMSGSHMEVAGVIKPHNKDDGRDHVTKGRSSSHMEATSVSKTHKNNKGEVGVTGRLTGQGEDPFYAKTGKTGQREVILSGKLNEDVSGAGVTRSHPKVKDEVTILKRISDSQVSGPDSIQQGRKGSSGINIIHRKSNAGQEGFGFTSTHQQEVGSREKINRNAHEGPRVEQKAPNRLGITFQEDNQSIVKGKVEDSKATGITADLKRSEIESSNRKAQHSGQESSGIKSALSQHHGSRDSIKRGPHVPKRADLKSQEHSPSSYKKVTKTSKQRSKVSTGIYRGHTAKKHHGYSGIWRRKSSRSDKKRSSIRHAHGSDSSQSSESAEDSRNDSRQLHKDYQNDKPDSYQSVESVEQNLSVGSNQSDGDHSQMEDQETSSQESSHEHKNN